MGSSERLTLQPRGDREIVMTRAFDAPRDRVFDALTRPELLERWLAARGDWSLAVCEIDLRVGGEFRFVWRHEPEGADVREQGVYREIVRPSRLVYTEELDDPWHPGESLIAIDLAEEGGRTTLSTTLRYESPGERDEVLSDEALNAPMRRGVAERYDKLAEVLAAHA